MKKKYLLITVFAVLLLHSCKTKKKIIRNIPFYVWKKLGPDTTYVDTLNKFAKNTETYWFGNGRVSSLWADPKDANHILAGVGFSAVFETKNAGNSWQNITKNIPVIDVKKIVKKDGIFYIATGYRFKNPIRFSTIKNEFYGYGVLHSNDDGKTWSKPSGDFYCADFSLTKKHKTAYAIDYKKLYKSNDSLNSFNKIFDFTKMLPFRGELINVVVHPTNKNLVYVSSAFGNTSNDATLFFSTDGGKTFTNKTPIFKKFAPKPISDLGYYVKNVSLFYDEISADLFVHFSIAYRFLGRNKKAYFKVKQLILKSSDFNNFTLESISDKKNGYHFIPFIQKIDTTFFIKDWYLKRKTPSYKVFKDIGQGKTHQDTRAVAVAKDGTIYYGNDAGLFKSRDKGVSWQDAFKNLNANLIIESGYYSDKDKRRISFGTQDCGFYINDFNGKPRYPIASHEGGIYQSPYNINRIYVKDRHIKITTDGGKKYRTIKMNDGKPLTLYHDDGLLRENVIDNNKLYASHYNSLFVSDSLGVQGTWHNITPDNHRNGRGSSLAISKKNPSILYFANVLITEKDTNENHDKYKYQTHLVKSVDGGKHWLSIDKEFKDLFLEKSIISTVITSDENPDLVWFSLRNRIEKDKVYFSNDGGISWKNISYNLPNVPVNRIVYDTNHKKLYIGNDLGVYQLENQRWKLLGKKLPKVIVTSMFLDFYRNELVISTFGQGIWYIPLKF